MILLQYGMQGSASSWLFNILSSLANELGHNQSRILQSATSSKVPWRKLAGQKMGSIDEDYIPFDLIGINSKIEEDEYLVLKTHSDRPDEIIELLLDNKLKVFASVRDPIDAAWSIYSKSRLARRNGTKEFSHINSIEHALEIIRGDCLKALTWRNFKNVYFYDFVDIKNRPAYVIESIFRNLELEPNLDFIEKNVGLKVRNYNQGDENNGYKNIEIDNIRKFYDSIKSI